MQRDTLKDVISATAFNILNSTAATTINNPNSGMMANATYGSNQQGGYSGRPIPGTGLNNRQISPQTPWLNN